MILPENFSRYATKVLEEAANGQYYDNPQAGILLRDLVIIVSFDLPRETSSRIQICNKSSEGGWDPINIHHHGRI